MTWRITNDWINIIRACERIKWGMTWVGGLAGIDN